MVKTKGNISYTISEIANNIKTDKRFIRFCEEKGLISPKIATFNRRIYSEYDRARLELILHCEASGYTMDQVIDLIGTPDPGLDKIEQFRNGLEHGEKRLDELIKQSEEVSFHQRTNIMTDVNLMKQYVKNLQTIKPGFLDELKAKPKPPEEEKIDLEPKVAEKPIEKAAPEAVEKPTKPPARIVPIFAVGIVLVLMIAGYVYYQNTTKGTKTIELAKDQPVKIEESKELSEKAFEEIKELPGEAAEAIPKETKIVLSKTYPDEQEAPLSQDLPEEAAETQQPAVEPPAQPDTKDTVQEKATEPETKEIAVAAVTQEQSSTPDVVPPPPAKAPAPQTETPEAKPAETTQPAPEQEQTMTKEQPEVPAEAATPASTPEATPEPAAEQDTVAVAATEGATKIEDPENRLKAFLAYYCHTYETKDMDKFFSLFTADATENDAPFNELKPKYQKNMEVIESLQYHIDMTDYSSIPETGNTLVQGIFLIKYRLQNKPWKEHSGNVTMELTQKDDSYRVKRLNYGK